MKTHTERYEAKFRPHFKAREIVYWSDSKKEVEAWIVKRLAHCPDPLSATIFDHRLKKYLLAIEQGRGSDAENQDDKIMTLDEMHVALQRGEGSKREKHVLRLKDKDVVLNVARFGEEWMAEISHDPRTDDAINRWMKSILKGRLAMAIVCMPPK